jgi:hypothetical protein
VRGGGSRIAVTGAWLSAALDAQAGHLMRVTDAFV